MEKIKISMEWYDQKFEALLKPSNNVWCDVIKYILECSNNNEPEEKYKCKNCGGEINKGEFDTFEVCDGCWDKPEEIRR